jgi:hypothetical protein
MLNEIRNRAEFDPGKGHEKTIEITGYQPENRKNFSLKSQSVLRTCVSQMI